MKAKEAQEKRYPHLGCESKKDSRRPSKRIERTSFFSGTIFRPRGRGEALDLAWRDSFRALGVFWCCLRMPKRPRRAGKPRKTKEAHEGQGGTGEKIPSFRLLV